MTYEVVLLMEEMRFFLVETFTWVKKTISNRIDNRKEGRYFNKSKETVLIFRRKKMNGKNFEIDMRHQRNGDAHFGFMRTDPVHGTPLRPDEHLCFVVETMLPLEKGYRYLYLYVETTQTVRV